MIRFKDFQGVPIEEATTSVSISLPSKESRKNRGDGFDMQCDCGRRVKGEECKDDGKMSGVGGMYPALRDSVFLGTQL